MGPPMVKLKQSWHECKFWIKAQTTLIVAALFVKCNKNEIDK